MDYILYKALLLVALLFLNGITLVVTLLVLTTWEHIKTWILLHVPFY